LIENAREAGEVLVRVRRLVGEGCIEEEAGDISQSSDKKEWKK